jgi:hypothetical protein
MKLRSIDIWDLENSSLRRFRCVEDTSMNRFAVVSVDDVHVDQPSIILNQELIFLEQMGEAHYLEFFDSIDLAIADHERKFDS